MIESILKIKEYKCFGENYEGFDCIYPINIVIGRNNSGKSSLLDIIELFVNKDPNKKSDYNFLYSKKLTGEDIRHGFKPGITGGGLNTNTDHWTFGQQYLNSILTVEIIKTDRKLVDISHKLVNKYIDGYIQQIVSYFNIDVRNYKIKRLRQSVR